MVPFDPFPAWLGVRGVVAGSIHGITRTAWAVTTACFSLFLALPATDWGEGGAAR